MIYDDASWHRDGNLPADLPPEAAATHTGMFLAWALLEGLGGELHVLDQSEDFDRLRRRRLTPGQYFLLACDGKFMDEDLNAEGNAFARAYFELEGGNFIGDYREFLAKGLPSEYHVTDSWANFDKLKPVIDRRLANWRRGRPADKSPSVKVRGSSDLPEDLVEKISSNFGSVEAPAILSRLAGFAGQFDARYKDAPDARVLRCVAWLAAGDRTRLEDACRLALTDVRDLVRRAEYDGKGRRIRDLNLPFEQT